MPDTNDAELRLRLVEAIMPAAMAEWREHTSSVPWSGGFEAALRVLVDAAHRVATSGIAQK